MSTFTPLTDVAWCLKAASHDYVRPVLTGLYVAEDEMVATDGHRLHRVQRKVADEMQVGLWGSQRGQQINATYPDYRKVIPVVKEYWSVAPGAIIPVLVASLAYAKERKSSVAYCTLPCTGETVDGKRKFAAFHAGYLKDVLAGRFEAKEDRVFYQASAPDVPMIWFVHGLTRTAVVMPIRRSAELETLPDPRFDLSEFVKEVAQ
jgi:hypothetical protein